jgi:hypothetical protein
MELYHYITGLPKGFNGNVGTVPLQYTAHANAAARNDRYGLVTLPRVIDTKQAQVIEVGLDSGRVSKIVYRVKYSQTLDLVLVVVPYSATFIVKTVWLNSKADQHETLDVQKYKKVG